MQTGNVGQPLLLLSLNLLIYFWPLLSSFDAFSSFGCCCLIMAELHPSLRNVNVHIRWMRYTPGGTLPSNAVLGGRTEKGELVMRVYS